MPASRTGASSRSFPVAVLTIGNEVLSGRTSDTNFLRLARALTDAGAETVWHASCRDVVEEMAEALRTALRHGQLVVVTGGLGPTSDDLTRKVVAMVLERPLVLNDRALAEIRGRFESRGLHMNPINEVQALLPQGAQIVPNAKGTAPGFLVPYENRHLLALPGVPWEMEAMLQSFLVPWVTERTGGGMTSHLVIRTSGIPESALAEKLEGFEQTLPEHATLAYLPHGSGVDLRVTFRGTPEEVDEQRSEVRAQLIAAAGDYVYAEGDGTLEDMVGTLLQHKQATLATAESCTGGLLAERVTRVPGSSAWFERGVVTYSNRAKTQLLGLKVSLLKKVGAVSGEVAEAMASGIRQRAGANFGIGITGIAGPGGGTEDKPVGLVYVALAGEEGVQVHRHRFSGDRDLVRQRSATAALEMLRRHLLGLPEAPPTPPPTPPPSPLKP